MQFKDKINQSVADAVAKIMGEALHPNQQKLDVHEPEKDKLTAKDFEMLRKGKKAVTKEEVENLDEVKMADLPSTKVQGRAYGSSKPQPSALDLVKGPKEKDLKSIESEKKKPVKEDVETLDEKLSASADAGDYIKDFQKSDAPQFQGKSPEKRRIMGIAAYLAAKRGK